MLSVPLCRLPELLLFFVFPIVACAMGGLSYGTIFRRSLVVLPFVVFIGVFNLFYDREPVFRIGTLAVTAGWVSFLSIVLRGLLSVQALLVLIGSTGYYGLCRSMQRLGVPAVFTTQLLFVYRYLFVLIEEGRGHAAGPRREEFRPQILPAQSLGNARRAAADPHLRPGRTDQPGDARPRIHGTHLGGDVRTSGMENARYPVSRRMVLGTRPAAPVPSGRKLFDADKQLLT